MAINVATAAPRSAHAANRLGVARTYGRRTLNAGICALLAGAVCGLSSPRAYTQPGADAELARGEHIARFVCATCHTVAKDQEFKPSLSHPAPSFLDIANRPGVSAESLRQFIATTHWDPDKIQMTMPAVGASPDQAQAVIRYILSLKRPRG